MRKSDFERKLKVIVLENERLQEENACLRLELKELKDRVYGRRHKKDPPPEKPASPTKKRGALFGHLGWFRKTPGKIDKIVEVPLEECPICKGRNLKECSGVKTHIQEDIVLAQPISTMYRKHRYYCHVCKKVVIASGENEIERSRIGPLAKSLAAYLKYQVKVSDRDIRKIFSELFGLKFTVGSLVGFRDQLRIRLEPVYNKLIGQIRRSRLVHADETGWSIDGKSGWCWSFSNKKTAICHIDRSRGGKVPQAILGKNFKGTLITDFYAGYNKVKSIAKQRCLVHLLRDLKRIDECQTTDEPVRRFCSRLKTLIYNAVELSEERNDLSKINYTKKQKRILKSFTDLKLTDPTNKITRRFVKRLERHHKECLTFLDIPGVPWHNNHAERMIRPNVLLRKITFGNRSPAGLKNHNVLMSIIQTAKLNGLDPLVRLRKLLLDSVPLNAFGGLSPP